MSLIYNNLPLPLYLLLTIVLPTLSCVVFFKMKKQRKSLFFSAGFVCICLIGYLSAYIRIAEHFDWQSDILIYLPHVLILILGIMFILIAIGAYQLSENNKEMKKIVLITSSVLLVSILFFIAFYLLKT